MKLVATHILFVLSAMAAAPMANAAANHIQVPLSNETVYDDKTQDKFCFYKMEINLGDAKTAKPFQLLKQTGDNRYEELRNWQFVSINDQGFLMLNISLSAEAKGGAACPATQEIILLN